MLWCGQLGLGILWDSQRHVAVKFCKSTLIARMPFPEFLVAPSRERACIWVVTSLLPEYMMGQQQAHVLVMSTRETERPSAGWWLGKSL